MARRDRSHVPARLATSEGRGVGDFAIAPRVSSRAVVVDTCASRRVASARTGSSLRSSDFDFRRLYPRAQVRTVPATEVHGLVRTTKTSAETRSMQTSSAPRANTALSHAAGACPPCAALRTEAPIVGDPATSSRACRRARRPPRGRSRDRRHRHALPRRRTSCGGCGARRRRSRARPSRPRTGHPC